MATTIRNDEFYNLDKDQPMGIHAKQNRAGRWQFRVGDSKGKMIASGMTPAEFAHNVRKDNDTLRED